MFLISLSESENGKTLIYTLTNFSGLQTAAIHYFSLVYAHVEKAYSNGIGVTWLKKLLFEYANFLFPASSTNIIYFIEYVLPVD